MRKISKWDGPLRFGGSTGEYLLYRVDAHVTNEDDSIDHGCAIITANSSDERGDQNVNWEVGVNGSGVKRGHTRTVRQAKARSMVALRRALKIGSSPFTSRKRAREYGKRKRAW